MTEEDKEKPKRVFSDEHKAKLPAAQQARRTREREQSGGVVTPRRSSTLSLAPGDGDTPRGTRSSSVPTLDPRRMAGGIVSRLTGFGTPLRLTPSQSAGGSEGASGSVRSGKEKEREGTPGTPVKQEQEQEQQKLRDEPPRERETMKASAPPLLLLLRRRRPRAEA